MGEDAGSEGTRTPIERLVASVTDPVTKHLLEIVAGANNPAAAAAAALEYADALAKEGQDETEGPEGGRDPGL